MNPDNIVVGEKIKISMDLTKTEKAFKFDGRGVMKSMRGKVFSVGKISSNSNGRYVLVNTYLFHPDDILPIDDAPEIQKEVKTFLFDPTNLLTGKPKCQKTKKS